MPELPEVETVARQLGPVLKGQEVRGLKIIDPKLRSAEQSRLKGLSIAEVGRLGKQIVLTLAAPGKAPRYVLVHLRMTGRLIWSPVAAPMLEPGVSYVNGPQAQAPNSNHLRATINCDGGALHFYDARRFGTLIVCDSLESYFPKGVDPTSSTFTLKLLRELLSTGRQPIKSWLLRQDRIVGLGNIYASEILYSAGIHPETGVNLLNDEDIRRLHAATKQILRRAIKHCGTTFSDFQDSTGSIGGYQRYLKVYNRQGLPCANCQAEILRIVQQGRSSFYCPSCQSSAE